LVTDRLSQWRLQLLRDARGDRAGGDAARLRVADEACRSASEFKADLRQLGGLARTGLAADDDDLMLCDGGGDLVAAGADRQFIGIGRARQCRLPGCAPCRRFADTAGDIAEAALHRLVL